MPSTDKRGYQKFYCKLLGQYDIIRYVTIGGIAWILR